MRVDQTVSHIAQVRRIVRDYAESTEEIRRKK